MICANNQKLEQIVEILIKKFLANFKVRTETLEQQQ